MQKFESASRENQESPQDLKRFYSNDPYEVLGLSRTATKEDVVKARNELQRQFHPDINTDSQALVISQNINNAYDDLQERINHQSRETVPYKMSELSIITRKWWKDLFDLDDVRKTGYQEYLNSDNSLHQLWGAATLLAERVDGAMIENREDLTPEEREEIKIAFLKAATTRRKELGADSHEASEFEQLANNVDILETIIQVNKMKKTKKLES